MRIAIKIELAVKEQTHGGDNPDENEEQGCGRASGKRATLQIVRFFFKRVDQQCPETVEIGEGQLIWRASAQALAEGMEWSATSGKAVTAARVKWPAA